MIDAIERLADTTIQRVVGRTPTAFMADVDKGHALAALRWRRDNLRQIFGRAYPEIASRQRPSKLLAPLASLFFSSSRCDTAFGGKR